MLSPLGMSSRKVGILGLGLSGMAAASALAGAGATLWLHDDNTTPATVPDGATLCPWQDWPWDQLDSMVISPGIPHQHPSPHPAAARATAAGIEIISEIEIAMRAQPAARIVVITGTNGKSTTTALLGHCLRTAGIATAVGGNIGEPACQLTDPGQDGVIVLELSSYQLETTPSLQADIAAILNISPDHLDRHGGMDGYVTAKARALEALTPQGLALLGTGDAHVDRLAERMAATDHKLARVTADMAPAATAGNGALAGAHNAENAATVAICMRHLGCADDIIDAGIASFTGLPHRLEPVASKGAITFVNDSKATNGVATAKALTAFDNVYWIAGGQPKEDGLGPAAAATASVRQAYLIGSSAEAFDATLTGICPTRVCGDLETATHSAFSDALAATDDGRSEATILLSPAAASFDQFDSFAARGSAFTALAKQLCVEMPASQLQEGGAHA